MASSLTQWSRTAALAIHALVMPVGAGAQARDQCAPSAATSSDTERLRAGSYRVTFVATAGSRIGFEVTGDLVLTPSRPTDGRLWSPSGSQVPDTSEHPLIGYTSVDLRAVGAPIAPDGDSLHPAPDSRNATYPGVLALAAHGVPGRVEILIGTLANRRDGTIMEDGGGIMLKLTEHSSTGIRGRWGAFGLVTNGSGHFCAVRISEIGSTRPNGGW